MDELAIRAMEEDQARAYARLYLVSTSVPAVERVYFFGMGDLVMNGPLWGQPCHDEVNYMELVGRSEDNTQLRPKPALDSLRTVVKMISETTYKGRIELDSSQIWALKYQRDSEAIVALWSLDEDVTLPLQDASVIESVTSMVGDPILLSDDELQLSGRPIYVKVAAENLASLQGQLAPLPGDYDRDGDIDASDYTVWRDTLGQSLAVGTGADGNADGFIGRADYEIWKINFGETAGSQVSMTASVPEPGSLLLLGIGLAGLWQTTAAVGRRIPLG